MKHIVWVSWWLSSEEKQRISSYNKSPKQHVHTAIVIMTPVRCGRGTSLPLFLATVWYLAMKSWTGIHDPQRMNHAGFSDPLAFPPAPPVSSPFWFSVKYTNNCWIVIIFGTDSQGLQRSNPTDVGSPWGFHQVPSSSQISPCTIIAKHINVPKRMNRIDFEIPQIFPLGGSTVSIQSKMSQQLKDCHRIWLRRSWSPEDESYWCWQSLHF